MKIGETLYMTTRKEWRKWLAKYHRAKKEIWLIYYRDGKHPSLSYDEQVEEAICFGWINSILKLIGEKKYASRFSPRRKNSKWHKKTKARALKMLLEGKMTTAGKAVLPSEVLKMWQKQQ